MQHTIAYGVKQHYTRFAVKQMSRLGSGFYLLWWRPCGSALIVRVGFRRRTDACTKLTRCLPVAWRFHMTMTRFFLSLN